MMKAQQNKETRCGRDRRENRSRIPHAGNGNATRAETTNKTYGSGQRKEQKTRTPPSRTKGNIMKNNTFNQIVNANLASVDPGFGQFALAKASADLFKKVINK